MHEMSRHHRLPRSLNGKTNNRNCIMIKDNLHRSWHVLFSNLSAPEIARLITEVYIDPAYRMVAELKPRRQKSKQLHLNL
jgi:hypothetical protein